MLADRSHGAPANTHNEGKVLEVIRDTLDSFDNIVDDLGENRTDLLKIVGGLPVFKLGPSDVRPEVGKASEVALVDTVDSFVGDVDLGEDIFEVDSRLVSREDVGSVGDVDLGQRALLLCQLKSRVG